MNKLDRDNLWSLEEYSQRRADYRAEVMQLKKARNIAIGENARLYFENEQTIRYQIQEMLRIEKVFEAEGIQEELDAYNPLIPDGSNWKATFMLEYEDANVRAEALAQLVGIEEKVWVGVEGFDKVWPICDEDLERSNEEKTSSVHFMRWEFSNDMIVAIQGGAAVQIGIDHENYSGSIMLTKEQHESLANDLQQSTFH